MTKPLPKTTQISKLCLKTAASVLGEFHTGEDREVPRPGLRPSRVFPQLQWLHAEGDGTAFSLPCEVCVEPALWAVGWGHWVGRQRSLVAFRWLSVKGLCSQYHLGPSIAGGNLPLNSCACQRRLSTRVKDGVTEK